MTPDQIYNLLEKHFKPLTFAPFCDVSGGFFPILNCFQAFEKEIALAFLNYGEFKVKAYNEDRKTLGLCWIVPGKLLALDDQVTTEEHLYIHKKSLK